MSHSIFDRFPLAEDPVETSAGPQPTPYHVYDGHAILIGGTADLGAVQELLEPEQVIPIQTRSGRALMAIWVADEPEASHGAHGELQVSFYVSHKPMAPVADAPFAILHCILTEPDARQMCHGLWNDTEAVVAYNREILGLSPHLARYYFERGNSRIRFSFHEVESDAPIVHGDVRELKRPSLAATIALFRTFGLADAIRAAATKVIESKVVNPISDNLPYNADALVFSSSDSLVAQIFDPGRDRLEILDARYARLDFKPSFIEHMRGFKLVYLPPDAR